ncbi:MAG TPA: hypothetical protein VLT16_08310, partial [Candidatus Limnocylindrales bacterium]|nr:hypothetical protein [Candidatus Limnocylindrales bacterium]
PGSYQLRLTVNGKSYTQPFKLVMDPRVAVSAQDLHQQFALASRLSDVLRRGDQALAQIHERYQQSSLQGDERKQLAEIEPPANTRPRNGQPSLSSLAGNVAQLMVAIDGADAAPTTPQAAAAEQLMAQVNALVKRWEAIRGK